MTRADVGGVASPHKFARAFLYDGDGNEIATELEPVTWSWVGLDVAVGNIGDRVGLGLLWPRVNRVLHDNGGGWDLRLNVSIERLAHCLLVCRFLRNIITEQAQELRLERDGRNRCR